MLMAERKGECCIARWSEGHVANGFNNNTSKMDMIMLKFRPIAPKPVSSSLTTASATSDGSGSGDVRHPKAGGGGGRGRKKTTSNNSGTTSSTSIGKTYTKKRKSSSPENNTCNKKADPMLLPLFPEEPDLSPTSSSHVGQNIVPFWVKFDNSGITPAFEDNYGPCHRSWC